MYKLYVASDAYSAVFQKQCGDFLSCSGNKIKLGRVLLSHSQAALHPVNEYKASSDWRSRA